MKRLVLLIPILAGLALAPAASAKAPRAIVTTCDRVHHAAVFEGRMDTVPGAARMQMSFRLQVSTPDQPVWTRLSVPGFSAWVTSDPERTRYLYSKRVEALLAPAAYRVFTRFRWLDAKGAVLRSARAFSKPCRQPDPRADLRVIGLGFAPGAGGYDRRYDIALRNTGRSAAPASTVRLELASGAVLSAGVPPIAPGGREDVFVTGPACRAGELVTVIADAGDAVDERNEANAVSLPCPSA
jgi:hypothetical protein